MADPLRWTARIRTERKARRWDVHTMARRLRDAAGEDRCDLPDHEGLVRSIRRWESGKIALLSERYRLLFSQALGMSEEALFSEKIEVPMPRPPADAHHDLSAMSSFRGADRRVGGGHLYATVLKYLERDVAPRLFSTADGATAFVAAAAFTEMAGWMAHDAGQDEAAERHFRRAHDLVQVGEDSHLEAHILGSLSHLAHHFGHASDAVRHAYRGTTVLADAQTQAPALKARLLVMAAHGFASMGNSAECGTLLLQAEKALDRSPGDNRSPWAGPFDEGALALGAARCMLALGQFREARKQADIAVALRPGDRTRSRALAQLVQASVLIAEGDHAGACRVAMTVADDTRSLSSLVVTRHLANLRASLEAYRGEESAAASLIVLDAALKERLWLYEWRGAGRGTGGAAV
ncbi:hypothetical protein [Nonomuraea sp. NPDC003201]